MNVQVHLRGLVFVLSTGDRNDLVINLRLPRSNIGVCAI